MVKSTLILTNEIFQYLKSTKVKRKKKILKTLTVLSTSKLQSVHSAQRSCIQLFRFTVQGNYRLICFLKNNPWESPVCEQILQARF